VPSPFACVSVCGEKSTDVAKYLSACSPAQVPVPALGYFAAFYINGSSLNGWHRFRLRGVKSANWPGVFGFPDMRRGWTEWGKWVGGRLTPFPSFSCVLKVDQAQGFQFAHNTGGHWPATSRHVMSCNFRTCTCLVRPKLCQRPDSES